MSGKVTHIGPSLDGKGLCLIVEEPQEDGSTIITYYPKLVPVVEPRQID